MKLRQKFLIIFLIATVLPILFIAIFNFITAKDFLRQETLSSLHALADFKEEQVFFYINTIKSRTADFASDGFIRDRVEEIITSNSTTTMETLDDHLIKNKKILDSSILFIDILDLNGNIIASTGDKRVAAEIYGEGYFDRFANETMIKDLRYEETHHLEVLTPVKARLAPEKSIGSLVVHYDARILSDVLTGEIGSKLGARTQSRGMGTTGETYLVNKDSLIITESIFVESAILNQKVDTYPVKKCLEEGEEIIGTWKDYRGVEVAGASMCLTIEDFVWVLITEQDISEVFAHIGELRNTALLIGFSGILLVAILTSFVSKRISDRVIKLTELITRVSNGDLNLKVVKSKSQDEIARLGDSFNRMTESLKEADRAKTEFVSLASHQLRTPLSVISWYIEMLMAGDAGQLNQEQKKYLAEVYKGNRAMVELVNSLLDVSRIEMGTISIKPQPASIIKIMDGVIELYKLIIAKNNLEIKTKYEKGLPLINVDIKFMAMILQNILDNAIKYNRKGGNIFVDIKKVDENIIISISDTGIGIPKKQQHRVFTKLFRADNVKKTNTSGTGLGLYLVKSILDNSGGTIVFSSEENKGSTFIITLPLTGMKKVANHKNQYN